jgi:shikimate dehydrogenase
LIIQHSSFSLKQLGLIGKSLKHSFSQSYFEKKFADLGIQNDYSYGLFELSEINELRALIASHPDLLGFNVTIPYKASVLPFLDQIDGTAQSIGAVNCIKILRENDSVKLIGYNTDAFGFEQSIKPFLATQHDKALILGNGGASKAIKHVLKNKGLFVAHVVRDKSKYTDKELCFSYDEISAYVLSQFKMIVNTTPLGTFPDIDHCPNIPYTYLSSEHLCYDLVYNPTETLFLKNAKVYGADIVNGMSMLQWQAEKAWEIWRA